MAPLKSLWNGLHPYGKVVVAAITAGLVGAFAPSVAYNTVNSFMGKPMVWPTHAEAWTLGWRVAVVAAVTYWMKGPQGREVWTDEQRNAVRDAIKDGKL